MVDKNNQTTHAKDFRDELNVKKLALVGFRTTKSRSKPRMRGLVQTITDQHWSKHVYNTTTDGNSWINCNEHET